MTNEDKIIKAFGENVRKARKAKGWSQSRLSHEAELDAGWISRIELGKVNPGLIIVVTLAKALKCKPGDLINDL
jgi:transcriptional regulator with XRE-family HTH domain